MKLFEFIKQRISVKIDFSFKMIISQKPTINQIRNKGNILIILYIKTYIMLSLKAWANFSI